MKISLITATMNSAGTVEDCLRSVDRQSYGNWEHLIIDGNSVDNTVSVVEPWLNDKRFIFSERDDGIYDAMNKGIIKADGDIIGILNSDDFYDNQSVFESVIRAFSDPEVDACYADLVFVDSADVKKVRRFWKSEAYKPGDFLKGWNLPHPTFFVRRDVYQRFGGFDISFRLGGDWDLMLRLFEKGRIRSRYVPELWVRMRTGGASSVSLGATIRNNVENLRAFRKNDLWPRWNYFFYRPIHRIRQVLSARF